MTPAQAMAHGAAQMEKILGQTFPPRSMLGPVIGWRAKAKLFDEEPLPSNMPIDKHFLIADQRDLETGCERART